MILLIDNYDSFTYNIVQYCLELGANLKIIRNDEMSAAAIGALNPQKLILSPGPSSPNEAGVTLEAISYFQNRCPILGICLGHQAIGQAFGGEVVHAQRLMHGKTDTIRVVEPKSAIFAGLPAQFRATRYHSLAVKCNLSEKIIVTAKTDDDEIMALEIRDKPIYGVQFHPESIMSEYGHEILRNFLKL